METERENAFASMGSLWTNSGGELEVISIVTRTIRISTVSEWMRLSEPWKLLEFPLAKS